MTNPKTLLANPTLAAHFAKLRDGERGAVVVNNNNDTTKGIA